VLVRMPGGVPRLAPAVATGSASSSTCMAWFEKWATDGAWSWREEEEKDDEKKDDEPTSD
jgi:hypothetical protein